MRPSHVSQLLDSMIQAPDVPGRRKTTILLTGVPGTGKTSVVRQAGERNKIRLLFRQPLFDEAIDWSGVPHVVHNGKSENARTWWASPGWVPEGERCLVLIDEMTQCDPSMMKALAPLCEEHRIGNTYLPPGSIVVGTGNKAGMRAGANRLLSHLQNRLAEVPFESNLDDFEEWGVATGRIIPEVRYYLRFKPSGLNNFDHASELPFASQRAWEDASDLYQTVPAHLMHQVLLGRIGPEAASFLAFAKIWQELTNSFDVSKILKNPDKAPIPKKDQLDIIWSVVGSIAEYVKDKEVSFVGQALAYYQRLPREFLFIGAQHLFNQPKARRDEIRGTKAWQDFAVANKSLLAEAAAVPGVK